MAVTMVILVILMMVMMVMRDASRGLAFNFLLFVGDVRLC